jgi:hypothetical protein
MNPFDGVILTALISAIQIFLVFRKRRKVKFQIGVPDSSFIGKKYISQLWERK